MLRNIVFGIVLTLGAGFAFSFLDIQKDEVIESSTQSVNRVIVNFVEDEISTMLETEAIKIIEDNETRVVNETKEFVENLVTNITSQLEEEMVAPSVSPNIPIVSTESVVPPISFSDININAREALVNIVCSTDSGGYMNPISGSGIIIDPRGLILTNAHVAQYYLIRDYEREDFIKCTIRTGSPARVAYKAEPVYISESWITENANNLNETNPRGTGQDDFAILAITESAIEGIALPESFPFIGVSGGTQLSSGQSVFIGGYPAGFLSGQAIQKDLNITSTVSQISEIYTFDIGTVDFITVDGSILSQKGASGGAVINDKENVIGLVVTSTDAASTGDRVLGAITTGHINISLLQQTGEGLAGILNGDIANMIEIFKTKTAPPLKEVLYEVLD